MTAYKTALDEVKNYTMTELKTPIVITTENTQCSYVAAEASEVPTLAWLSTSFWVWGMTRGSTSFSLYCIGCNAEDAEMYGGEDN